MELRKPSRIAYRHIHWPISYHDTYPYHDISLSYHYISVHISILLPSGSPCTWCTWAALPTQLLVGFPLNWMVMLICQHVKHVKHVNLSSFHFLLNSKPKTKGCQKRYIWYTYVCCKKSSEMKLCSWALVAGSRDIVSTSIHLIGPIGGFAQRSLWISLFSILNAKRPRVKFDLLQAAPRL